jgi:hypothetical protein
MELQRKLRRTLQTALQATLRTQAFLILSIVSLGGQALAAPVAAPVRDDGLVSVQAGDLDRAYVRPNANLGGYRKVLIEPVQVEFSRDWLSYVNDPRYVARLSDDDVRTIRNDTTANVVGIVADAFKARGYEIATAPGPDVLRVSPRVTELYVNAPNVFPPGITHAFARDAGEATLILEARDSASGSLLAVMSEHGTASDMMRFTRATQVTNTFWFDGFYKRAATDGVAQLETIKNLPKG